MGQNWYGTQSLNPTDSPTFDNLTLTGDLTCNGTIHAQIISMELANDGIVWTDGSYGMYRAADVVASSYTHIMVSNPGTCLLKLNDNNIEGTVPLSFKITAKTALFELASEDVANGPYLNWNGDIIANASYTYKVGTKKKIDASGFWTGNAGVEVLTLSAQMTHVADATGAGDVVAQLNAALAQLQAVGLMAGP